ncbi:von Willebrand factor type A [Pirellula staleyi DSM 6068]|uniref:von Willebrand factor type A n=1 Tax=Pirellula staleyi (strain ATCC 27377 / DSM 6068 / ICPB 4128) TaxID=530564 RepID=D2R6V4_PIRSD|nr:vWA domain-containing protein [Pirellula staleyi]ADB19157.1 von Willebrand factor type A [Pirellula staleyi DSM 6068]
MTKIQMVPSRKPRLARRGAMLVLIAFLLVVVVCMAAFAIDVSYMQLVRSELRAATDAAAKAGTLALAKTDGDAASARTAAIQAAARNKVAGRALVLTTDQVQVGRSAAQANGTWSFTANQTPYTSVKILSSMSDSTAAGSVPLFLGTFMGRGSFQPAQSATASQMEQEICLVIDRSHSMCFNMSGVEWSYPPGTKTTPHTICYPPHATLSRWAALQSSVNLFMDTILETNNTPRVALITWGSTIGTNTAEYSYTKKTEVAVANELGLSTDYAAVKSKIAARTTKVMLGGTNMSAGIDAGRTLLNGNTVRALAKKTMILMTDGQWNQGRDPIDAAEDAADEGIQIHTITFLSGSAQNTMRQVAEITGGKYYVSSNQAELEEAFRDLALTLPIVLTQ